MTQILCKVYGKKAMIVGYVPGVAGSPKAVIISEGILKVVNLEDVDLENLPKELRKKKVKKPASTADSPSPSPGQSEYDYQIRLV